MSFQTKQSFTQVIARFGIVLLTMWAAVALLALVVSRALPDGGAIGFLSSRDGNTDIYLLDIARGTLHNLTDNGAVNGGFAFSPDGTRIAFESNKDGNTEIYMMNVECPGLLAVCGGIVQLTDAETDNRSPVWSPDSRQIAYVYDVSFADEDNEIYVMDIESLETWNLTNHQADDRSPEWSPDGSQIAFVSDRDASSEILSSSDIYTAGIEGDNLRRLTDDPASSSDPAWSPDGNYIAFITNSNGESDIYLMSQDGSNMRRLTNGNSSVVSGPFWSPDGRSIISVSYADFRKIIIVNVGDAEVQEFLVNSTAWNIYHVSWSPDGTRILFKMEEEFGPPGIHVLDIRTRKLRRLTFGGGSPVWWP